MLVWYYGTTMILSAQVTDTLGAPQSDATVTYEIRNRADVPILSGTLTESTETEGTYEDRVDISEVLGEYDDDDDATLRAKLHRVRVVATLPNGVTRQSTPRIHLQHDTD